MVFMIFIQHECNLLDSIIKRSCYHESFLERSFSILTTKVFSLEYFTIYTVYYINVLVISQYEYNTVFILGFRLEGIKDWW